MRRVEVIARLLPRWIDRVQVLPEVLRAGVRASARYRPGPQKAYAGHGVLNRPE